MPGAEKPQIRPRTTPFDGGNARDGPEVARGGYGTWRRKPGEEEAMGAFGPESARFVTAQPEISGSNLDRKFPVGRNIPID